MHNLFATALQMFQPLKNELICLEKGVFIHDVSLAKEVLLVAPVLLVKCDNPRASELLVHMGSNANKFCRMCLVSLIISLYIGHQCSLPRDLYVGYYVH